jgi:hypothetical protein
MVFALQVSHVQTTVSSAPMMFVTVVDNARILRNLSFVVMGLCAGLKSVIQLMPAVVIREVFATLDVQRVCLSRRDNPWQARSSKY